MTRPANPVHTGGCQCGAVRFALYGEPTKATFCHCRMCQKAFGSYFAPLVNVDLADLEWTHGRPAIYASSNIAERGFCRDCGTPLTFKYHDKPDTIALAHGAFDDPASIEPTFQDGIESRMPWFDKIAGLPGERTQDSVTPEWLAGVKSNQHPDQE